MVIHCQLSQSCTPPAAQLNGGNYNHYHHVQLVTLNTSPYRTWHPDHSGLFPLYVPDNSAGPSTSAYYRTHPLPHARASFNCPPPNPRYSAYLKAGIHVRVVLLQV